MPPVRNLDCAGVLHGFVTAYATSWAPPLGWPRIPARMATRGYERAGLRAEAVEMQKKAVALCEDAKLKAELEATLAEYEKKVAGAKP